MRAAFFISALRHQAHPGLQGPVHLIGVYVVEKAKPLATPVK